MTQYYHKRYSEIKIDVMSEALDDAMQMEPSHLILCIDMKSQLDLSDNIVDVLPDNLVRDLKDYNKGIYQGSDIYLLTQKISPCVQGGVAIAPFINLKLLPCITSCNPDAVIYIPWMEDELLTYQAQTNSTEI